MAQAPAAACGRPVSLPDPRRRLGSMSFAFNLSPVKVFSSEGMSIVDKQSLEECPKRGNLLYLPVPLHYSSPGPLCKPRE